MYIYQHITFESWGWNVNAEGDMAPVFITKSIFPDIIIKTVITASLRNDARETIMCPVMQVPGKNWCLF